MSSNSNFKFYVIGVGLSRTGTLSTKKALELLLHGRCMHCVPVELTIRQIMDAERYSNNDLNDIFGQVVSDDKFKQYFIDNNVVAGVDVPFITSYQQAMRVFPDALVLLTVRDPESWVKSVKNTILEKEGVFKTFPYFLYSWVRPPLRRIVKMLDSNSTNKDILNNVRNGNGVNYFNDYNAKIKATVPSERLLIFNVKDGWKPLCDALHLPIPDIDFPRINDTASMRFNFTFVKICSWGIFIAGVTVPILVGYGLKRYFEISSLYSLFNGKTFQM